MPPRGMDRTLAEIGAILHSHVLSLGCIVDRFSRMCPIIAASDLKLKVFRENIIMFLEGKTYNYRWLSLSISVRKRGGASP
jgi:hypothetical protein